MPSQPYEQRLRVSCRAGRSRGLCHGSQGTRGVAILSGPTDQPFGHRTLFFRDPDGNALEIYAEL